MLESSDNQSQQKLWSYVFMALVCVRVFNKKKLLFIPFPTEKNLVHAIGRVKSIRNKLLFRGLQGLNRPLRPGWHGADIPQ